jgi:hypothetical protein
MKKITGISALVVLLALTVAADIPKPAKSPKQSASINSILRINLKGDAKEARLIIPKSQLLELRAALEQMDDTGNTAAFVSAGGFSRTQTIVSGMFLSLAIVFGGIWFARSGKVSSRSGNALVIVAVLTGLGSAATFIYGNAGPPPEARSITGKMFTPAVHLYGFGSGQIKLETTDEDRNDIQLIVPDPQTTPTPGE